MAGVTSINLDAVRVCINRGIRSENQAVNPYPEPVNIHGIKVVNGSEFLACDGHPTNVDAVRVRLIRRHEFHPDVAIEFEVDGLKEVPEHYNRLNLFGVHLNYLLDLMLKGFRLRGLGFEFLSVHFEVVNLVSEFRRVLNSYRLDNLNGHEKLRTIGVDA